MFFNAGMKGFLEDHFDAKPYSSSPKWRTMSRSKPGFEVEINVQRDSGKLHDGLEITASFTLSSIQAQLRDPEFSTTPS